MSLSAFEKIRKSGPDIIIFLFFLIIIVLTTIFKWNKLPPQIPLFYSLPDGDEQVVDLFYIFVLPIIAFVILLFNRFISHKYFSTSPFILAVIKIGSTILISLLMIIYLRIIFLIS